MSDQERSEIDIPEGSGQQCPCFVVFLRILLKYLQNHGDKQTYEVLRRRVQVCTEKARRGEPGYECVAKAVLQEIPQIVKHSDLRRVQAILRARVNQKKKRTQDETTQECGKTPPTGDSCERFDIFKPTPLRSSYDTNREMH